MPGAVLQLAAYGVQDIYLTGNPQITFFKVVYRRYSNFAIESIKMAQNYNVSMGNSYSFKIERQGDLLSSIFLHIRLTNPNIVQTYLGFSLIETVELKIGSQTIDKQYGEWMAIWCDLTHSYNKSQLLDDMICNSTDTIIVPLQFWFCRNPGLAIPLIALQYHEIQLNIKFKKSTEIKSAPDISEFEIYTDYIFIDTDERRRYVQLTHEYLIEQVQMTESGLIESTATKANIDLEFTHPVKELMWIIYDVSGSIYNPIHCELANKVLIQLNNQDRLSERTGLYFTRQQRYQFHSGAGAFSGFPHIHIYSFALRPEEHQPSGTCNFSRIDDATIHMQLNTATQIQGTEYRRVRVYAVNYNVLRIINGLGGLAYTS
jgi:hypothetical protein